MPIYEYLCPSCDCRFELLRSISQADEAASCPNCRAPAKKLLSLFAAFSKSSEEGSTSIGGMGSACSSCAATSCASCRIPS